MERGLSEKARGRPWRHEVDSVTRFRERVKKMARESIVADFMEIAWRLVTGPKESPFGWDLWDFVVKAELAVGSFAGGIAASICSVPLHVILTCFSRSQCPHEDVEFILFALAGLVSLFAGPAAIVLGSRTLRHNERGRWLAVAGIILGSAPIIVLGIFVLSLMSRVGI